MTTESGAWREARARASCGVHQRCVSQQSVGHVLCTAFGVRAFLPFPFPFQCNTIAECGVRPAPLVIARRVSGWDLRASTADTHGPRRLGLLQAFLPHCRLVHPVAQHELQHTVQGIIKSSWRLPYG